MLVQGLSNGVSKPDDSGSATTPAGSPWEGFYDAFEFTPPDAIERHDEIIAREALERHTELRYERQANIWRRHTRFIRA